MIPCMLTFDVEDWFQTENLRPAFPVESWDRMPRRVAASTRVVLDLLASNGIRSTFFILGWVAEREPDLIRAIAAAGHEIASHGYSHVMPMQQTTAEFQADVRRSRAVLETIMGSAVTGYRAPSFSIDETRLAILRDAGFIYDSSRHPFGAHERYGRLRECTVPVFPGVYRLRGLVEVELPVERVGPILLPASGGGYFRLYPERLFRQLVRRVIARQRQYTMYLHSWEFDAGQPRISVGLTRTFRHYNNLSRTLPRMMKLIEMLRATGGRFLTVGEFVAEVAASS